MHDADRHSPDQPHAGSVPAPPDAGHGETVPAPRHRTWTPDQVRALGMTTNLATAAGILGIGRTLARDLAKTDDFPVRVLRMGRRVVVPVGDLLTMLGADHQQGSPASRPFAPG